MSITKTIFPQGSSYIPAIEKSYNFTGGRATVQLDSLGNYEVLVNGQRYSSLEKSAKRSPEYKNAITFVSQRMAGEFRKKDEDYLGLHKNFPKIQTLLDQQKNIDSLILQNYERESFPLSRPDMADIRKELKEEAEIKFADLYDDKQSEKKEFVNNNDSNAFRGRIQAYEEVQEFFNGIQEVKEQKANRTFQRQYDKAKQEIIDYINGENSITEEKIKTILNSLSLPYRVDISCFYSKSDGLLQTDIELSTDLNLPSKKVSILASGKISVKDKLVKEIEQFKTEAILSLIYYIAGSLFNGSINIQKQQVTVWINGKGEGILQVVFDRDRFVSQDIRTMNLLGDYNEYPRIDRLRIVRGAAQFDTLPKEAFN